MPSLSHMASYQPMLMMKTLSFDSTSGTTFHLGGLTFIGYQYNSLTDTSMVYFHVQLQLMYSHGRIRIGFYGFGQIPWVTKLYNLSCARLCYAL